LVDGDSWKCRVRSGGKYHVHYIVTLPQPFLCRDKGVGDRVDTEQGAAFIFSVEKRILKNMSLKAAIFLISV
jgi:hypothetical protein